MSIFSTIYEKAIDVWHAFLDFLTPAEKAAVEFAEPTLHAIAQEIGEDGLAAVKAAVAAAEESGGTGPEKLTKARKMLENTLKAAKPDIKDSLINAAIEIAVVGLKALVSSVFTKPQQATAPAENAPAAIDTTKTVAPIPAV
jgi:hypothetical protein